MSKQSKRHERQEAQKRREHQLGQEYGRSNQPCFGELQQISKNAPLRNRLQMCLGSYDDAQKTMNAFGLKSVVGTETVPTTPGVDVKHGMFSSKTAVPLGYSQVHGDVKDKTSSLSKLTTSMSYPKAKKHEASSSNGIAPGHHQRPSYQQPQQPSRSSVSPKVTTHLSAVSSSQAPDITYTRQASPVVSKQHVKPVVPRPPSRQDNHPKEKKEKTHHHHGKEKRPDKERIKLQQEKAHQKPPKLLNKSAPVKNDHPSSYEDSQVKHIEPNSLNKTLGSGRPVIPSMPPSKSPHNRMIGRDSNIGVVPSGATVTAKPVPTKVPKPLPSPTVRTPFTGELFSESQRSPGKEKPDKNAVNVPLEVNMTLEKKAKEKKPKKKKHKSKTSELTKETEKLPPPVEAVMVEFTSEPKVQPHVPNKKPMAQKPPSLDLSNGNSASSSVTLKPPSKLLSPLLSPMEDSSQDTYLQKIFDEMAGPTSPFLPVIQTPYKTGPFTFGFPHISKPKDEVFTSSTTEAVPINQRQEVKQESEEIGYWNPIRVSDISEADIASVKRNPFMDDMEQELLDGVSLADDTAAAAAQGGPQEDHDSSSSDSSGSSDSESEGELLLSARSDFPDMDSLEDINFDVPIDTITPLRSNPSSFSFMEPDHHAQLEPPTHGIEPMSHFVMAPNLGVHNDTKSDHVDLDSNSSGSEDGDSSSDEGSSDSDMDDVEDLFVAASTSTTMDQTRSQLLVTSSVGPPAETTTVNHVTSSVAVTGPTIVNRPPAAMKRLRNMFAAVKPAEVTPSSSSSVSTTANTSVVQPLEAVTPITPVSMTTASFDTKVVTSMDVTKQQPMATVTATTVTSETTDTSHLLPRKNNTKRMTSISGKPDSKNSMLSEDSSSDSEGEESGEVTNSESEDEGAKPKPPKQAKWDDTPTMVETPETSKLQLICSISRQYMRPVHTPASTPKSPPTARIRPIMVAPEKKFRDRGDSTSEEHTGRNAYPQQPRDSLYHRRSRSREDSHEPDYPPRNRDHMRPHNRHNSRSMRSSSPDHHHHHSASRHRELPPPRGSSHWNHGWSNSSGDHHYSYDYDYGSTSHHYPRRNRHSARLNKPEIYMEDARKLKHSGDRTSSEIEKAHYYLDAALTYMTYCVCKEEEGDPDKEVMSTTIRLLKHIVQSPGLNMLARDVYCEMLSALCLRSQSVLSMKLFNTLSNNESISRNQKILSEYFSTKSNPQGRRSPFVGVSPSYSPANTTSGGCGSGSAMDNYANPSCHSPSANITIPGHIYNMAAAQFSVTSHLFNSQETWRHANNISEQHRDFFDALDRRSGPISLYSSMLTVVDWAKEGLRLLKNTRSTSSCRDY